MGRICAEMARHGVSSLKPYHDTTTTMNDQPNPATSGPVQPAPACGFCEHEGKGYVPAKPGAFHLDGAYNDVPLCEKCEQWLEGDPAPPQPAPDLAPLTGLPHIPSAIGWKCACGEDTDPVSGAWRWTGSAWEHHHGGQAGHFRATYTPPPAPPQTCSWRHYDEFEDFDAECGESFAFEDEPDFKRYPFCPACGGRIQLIKQ